ncbi:hypothetical protein V6615_06670 [Oscillospiraceae bacterium PP1C4]
MKNKILAAFLSLMMLMSFTPLSVFAATGGEPAVEPPVVEAPVVEAPAGEVQQALAGATSLDISKGNISITGTSVTYYEGEPAVLKTDSTPNALGYTITGVQGANTLTITNASVPITINADVNTNNQPISSTSTININANITAGAITTTSTVTIGAGKQVNAPSITQNTTATQYPVTVTLAAAANQPVEVAVDAELAVAMTADTTGTLYFWLPNGTHTFDAKYDGTNYQFKATTNNTTAVAATQYPVTVTLTKAANQPVEVAVDAEPAVAMTADAEGALYFWLPNGTHTFDAKYNGTNYQFKATTNNTTAVAAAPVLFTNGTGTDADPYLINSADQLANIASAPDKSYKLTQSGLTVTTPISAFSGNFDGNGNTIKLEMNADQAGLFAELSGTVKNLGLTGSVTTTGSRAGSVAGINKGTIQNVYSTASVTTSNASGVAGGIAGENQGTIHNCYTTGIVSANNNGGGIAGENQVTIQDCYTTGTVNANNNGGGIAGQSSGSIQRCYSTSTVRGGSAAGGIVGWQTGGSVQNSFALNTAVTGSTAGRVAGSVTGDFLSGNGGFERLTIGGSIPTSDIKASQKNGVHITYASIAAGNAYDGFLSTAWNMAANQMPTLKTTTGSPFSTQSVVIPSHLVYTPPSNGGGGGGGGDYEPPYSETFWEKMRDEIDDARSGDTIKFSTNKLDNMPTSILKEIKGRNITLVISHGREKITINGKRMHPIPKNRVFYTFDDLAELYEEQPAASSKPSSSSKPSVPSVPETVTSRPSQPQFPVPVTPPAPSSSAPSSSVSEPESSEEDKEVIAEEESKPADVETDGEAETEKPKRSKVPLIAAGIVIVLALAGGGAAFYFYRRRPQNFYDFDDDEK